MPFFTFFLAAPDVVVVAFIAALSLTLRNASYAQVRSGSTMGKRRFLSTSSSSSSSSCFKKKVKRTSTYERAPRSNSSSLVAFAACRHEETLQSLLLLPIISLAPYPLNC